LLMLMPSPIIADSRARKADCKPSGTRSDARLCGAVASRLWHGATAVAGAEQARFPRPGLELPDDERHVAAAVDLGHDHRELMTLYGGEAVEHEALLLHDVHRANDG
jgi:hypothetical protein